MESNHFLPLILLLLQLAFIADFGKGSMQESLSTISTDLSLTSYTLGLIEGGRVKKKMIIYLGYNYLKYTNNSLLSNGATTNNYSGDSILNSINLGIKNNLTDQFFINFESSFSKDVYANLKEKRLVPMLLVSVETFNFLKFKNL